ncbi:MAG: hypothetical protein NC344_08520 [Bacteroidales bacterium]|nr:hypothetical protein [Bacteroidales bacterium]MCM1147854.1 hypothetical protein [Bacteroidales bacterium]MCM1206697.1 hypothetical protein [Bacillota bacterium]MCM1510892.1 hypothetical protein [Clostridium sp.]
MQAPEGISPEPPALTRRQGDQGRERRNNDDGGDEGQPRRTAVIVPAAGYANAHRPPVTEERKRKRGNIKEN